jgi:hypothetical protein
LVFDPDLDHHLNLVAMRLPFFAAAAVYVAAVSAEDVLSEAASSVSSAVESATAAIVKPSFTVCIGNFQMVP